MDRVNSIIKHPLWISEMEKIGRAEETRIFCGHDLSHLLDVARIAYIFSLEKELAIDKEIIYAAALLHDIGRGREYTEGIPHDTAGAEIAERILWDSGFSQEEIVDISDAVSHHRRTGRSADEEVNDLPSLIYYADKKSRNCFACSAYDECKWSEEEKNREIED